MEIRRSIKCRSLFWWHQIKQTKSAFDLNFYCNNYAAKNYVWGFCDSATQNSSLKTINAVLILLPYCFFISYLSNCFRTVWIEQICLHLNSRRWYMICTLILKLLNIKVSTVIPTIFSNYLIALQSNCLKNAVYEKILCNTQNINLQILKLFQFLLNLLLHLSSKKECLAYCLDWRKSSYISFSTIFKINKAKKMI